MIRTPLGKRFIEELSIANDQIIYSAFAHHEFDKIAVDQYKKYPQKKTTASFPKNPIAIRLDVTNAELYILRKTNAQVGHRSGIIAGTEHALAYLQEMQEFRAGDDANKTSSDPKEPEEEKALRKLRIWSAADIEPAWFRTIGYFRLLRNHYAHANRFLHGAFRIHIANYGHYLNRFWNNGFTVTFGYDFQDERVNQHDLDHALAAMNFLRASIREIDAAFASTLRLEHVVERAIQDVWRHSPTLRTDVSKLARKVRTTLDLQYGERFPLDCILPSVTQMLPNLSKAGSTAP